MYRCSYQWAVWILGFTACSAAIDSSEDKLRDAVNQLNEGVRWGRIQDVLVHIGPSSHQHFLELHKDFGNALQVTNYEVVNTIIDMEQGTAEIGVKLTWYRIDEMEVHETVLSQRWEKHENRWLLTAEAYRSGTPL